MSKKLSGGALEFYKKHLSEIGAAVERVASIIVERVDPGACPQAVETTMWGCVHSAIENYFRSGQTTGLVVGKRISLLIAPHREGVTMTFGHVLDSQVLKQGPRVRPSLRPSRKSAARALSDAFAKFQVNHPGTVSEIMISPSDVARLRKEKPSSVVEGEIFGVPYRLIAEGESIWVE